MEDKYEKEKSEKKVKTSTPWEDGSRACLDANGTPPHTLLLVGNEEIKKIPDAQRPAKELFRVRPGRSGRVFNDAQKEMISK